MAMCSNNMTTTQAGSFATNSLMTSPLRTGIPACSNPRGIWPTMAKAGLSRLWTLTAALIIVKRMITKTVRRAHRKKKSFARDGYLLAQRLQVARIAYSIARAEIPMTASYLFEDGMYFRVSMIIWYAGLEVLKSAVSPRSVFTWPEQIMMADPVMKDVIDGRGMKSMMNPSLARPMNAMMLPQIIVTARAICGPGISG